MKQRKQKCFLLYYISFLFLLQIYFVGLKMVNNMINLKYYYSEIHLIIKGNGNQNLLSSSFNIEPSEVYINGIKDDSCKKTCVLEGDKNDITLRFENKIETCRYMFYKLENITNIDLSNFYTSKVTDMESMFYKCSNLEQINFGNINTSSLDNMRALFQLCSKLTSIDLSNFDTSKVTDMRWMFSFCSNLEKINFGNINTSSLQNMFGLFYNC